MVSLTGFDHNLAAIRTASATLRKHFEAARPDAWVPTCPDWRARDLIVHQGIIHRWAAANLRCEPDAAQAWEEDAVLATVPDHQLIEWSRSGAEELLAALDSVDPNVDAMVFLNNAGTPRDFWARRQAHETTIHAVDGLAATLGRTPTAAETGIDVATAADGIDELLRGFFTRGKSKLYQGQPVTIHVSPNDADDGWALQAGPDGVVVNQHDDSVADVTFGGTSAQLYLTLWNRGDEITVDGKSAILDHWRAVRHVTWG